MQEGRTVREYQKKGKYSIPQNVYLRTLYLIRDYERMRELYTEILYSSPLPPDGQPGSGKTSDETVKKVLQRETLARECRAVEQAILCIPEEYRSGVINNIMYRTPYPDTAGYATWSRHRQDLIRNVAKNMNYI